MRRAAAAVVALALGGGAAHGQDPVLERPAAPTLSDVKNVLTAGARPAVPVGAAPARPQDPEAIAARLAVLRRKVLRDDDFVENGDTNRDPFRSYLKLFQESRTVAKSQQVPSIFDKFALEELALIAIVSGDSNPRAMFRDPGGLGQVVKRGDYVSKAGARVTKILSDRVVLELNEVIPTGETRPIEKAILVNPEAAQR